MERSFPSASVINKNRSIHPKIFYSVALAQKKVEDLCTLKFKTNTCSITIRRSA